VRTRLPLIFLVAGSLFWSGMSCTDATLSIVSPSDNADVTTFSFPVQVDVTGIQAGSLAVDLNGAPVVLTGGPATYTATVNPGNPLRDDNVLRVRALDSAGLALTITRPFRYLPPKARVREITNASDLLCGPLAHGKLGDYLMENTVARFVVQDVAQRDIYSIGQYGGNLIDAELIGSGCKENFGEIQPSINIETVINAQTAEIVNDGQNGLAAQIRTCGPDDILDFINPSSVAAQVPGANFPAGANDVNQNVEGCTLYTLEPNKTRVKFDVTLFNLDPVQRGFYVGEYVNGMGELEQWTTVTLGGIGEMNTATMGMMAFQGYGEAEGVDYGLVGLRIPGTGVPSDSFFEQSGVSFILRGDTVITVLFLATPPKFTVAANGSRTFANYFGVGDGSGGNTIDLETEVKNLARGQVTGCVTAGGVPAPEARVSIGLVSIDDVTGTKSLSELRSTWVTDAAGCYSGFVPTGTWGVLGSKKGYLFEPGGTPPEAPFVHDVTVTSGSVSTVDIALPDTGRLHVAVTDEAGAAVPARLSVVGFDPSPEPIAIVPGLGPLPETRTGLMNDVTSDPISYGVSRIEYAGATGIVDMDLEPGVYQLVVSRGTEYSAYSAPITLTAGATTNIAAQIAHVVDTTGYISSDYHVHGIDSPDSRVSRTNRVMQFAGEGVDNIIMTDHESHTDLTPKIASLGLTPFVHATVGEEITSFDYGHFNAYPLLVDNSRVSRGAVDFGRAAPPGQDFTSLGAFNLSPAEIDSAARTGSTSTPDTVVQINHIDSHFGPLKINTSLVPPQSFVSAAEKLALRIDPSIPNAYHHFAALELWNGYSRGHQSEFLVGRIGIWFNLLNQGLFTTMIGDTDTHEFRNTRGGGARSWTPSTLDAPAGIVDAEIAQAVTAGRVVSGQGLYVQARLLAADGSGNVADFSRTGSTLVASANGELDLEIKVQAPLWAEYDRIEVYANSTTTVAGTNGGIPVAFGPGTPAATLNAGTDFTVSTVNVFPSVPGGSRHETTKSVHFSGLSQDTWFVVLVKGRDGVSRPMFPIMPESLNKATNTTLANLLDGNLGESGLMSLGNTNALYADVNGTAGFQAPLAP
jgi:hypothetical protein